ncbi:M28 family metallopeptidase [Mucilaginibacter arboris]|uniref:M28 family peptidase n=1 Tax=Mucilaginibacter arboris TaxID=2682090 RepID=A0A7K1SZH9_9SPHI|nr:M28 family metallopeptidase [Mucilaginibacter arboris]MVN22703.1 M28 family peptidase [Mucilaginibacter arboris]
MKVFVSLLAFGILFLPGKNVYSQKLNKPVPTDSSAIKVINAGSLAKRIQVLASDDFMGRKPFTAGETKTINYLKDQFQQMGLKPGNGNSYFQDVPMVDIASKAAGPLIIKGKNGTLSLNPLEDFTATTRHVQNQVQVNNSEMVFAGFGIVAPEYNWNDYAGLDVKGKTVVVMVNDPGFYDSKLFKGKNMTYYGRWTYKYEEAARQGAAALLIIHDTAPASYPWTVVRNSGSKSKLYLQTADNGKSRALLEGWITQESTHKLFKLAGISEEVIESAKKRGFKAVSLGLDASLTLNVTTKKSTSHNVVAVLPGTKRAGEYLIFSAHWDHFGIGEAIKGDSIYNGAVDNATGTAGLLTLAEAFSKLKTRPERSLMFLAVTSEEQGLLGSEYYTTHPIVPLKQTVADINMDVLNTYSRTKDLVVVGYGQSEMDDYAKRAAAKQGRVITPEPDPSGGWYYRSDHFNFAKVGVPSLYPEAGVDAIGHGAAWGKAKTADYTKNRYHSPFDEYDPKTWVFSGMVEDVRLLFDVGTTLANEAVFPKWKAGSEFKAIREKYRSEK